MSTFKEQLIAGATIVGAAVACIAVGYSYGKDTNDGLLNFLREKNQTAEKSEIQLRSEVSALKLELQTSKNIEAPARKSSSDVAASESNPSTPSSNPDFRRVELQSAKTESLFDGKVILSLVGVNYEGIPLRHKVTATIGATGKANQTLDKVDVGFATMFGGYEVRLVASDTFSATFTVTRTAGKS